MILLGSIHAFSLFGSSYSIYLIYGTGMNIAVSLRIYFTGSEYVSFAFPSCPS